MKVSVKEHFKGMIKTFRKMFREFRSIERSEWKQFFGEILTVLIPATAFHLVCLYILDIGKMFAIVGAGTFGFSIYLFVSDQFNLFGIDSVLFAHKHKWTFFAISMTVAYVGMHEEGVKIFFEKLSDSFGQQSYFIPMGLVVLWIAILFGKRR